MPKRRQKARAARPPSDGAYHFRRKDDTAVCWKSNHPMSAEVTRVNGWRIIFGCGIQGEGILLKAACAQNFPAVNVPQEAMYWTTSRDEADHTLNGQHDYILHFPPGGLPPNNAFWSLTMGDAQNHFVANHINRYCVGDRSGLAQNADGSVDIYIQNTAPAGHESNWLAARVCARSSRSRRRVQGAARSEANILA